MSDFSIAMRFRAPGFRFHPTDVELVMYYLKRKLMGRRLRCKAISVVDVYKFAPWELPDQAYWKGDLKWYFFCPRERKYSTGKRANRSTKHGFWKTTGNDRPVLYLNETVGMRKSLIFHTQNPPTRTDWVMHEYKLKDEYSKKLGLGEDAFVLCVIFEKEGPGPRNGAQYGAPFREEDWDDNDDAEGSDDDDHGDDSGKDDDDNERDNCEEDASVAGTLTQVHGVPYEFGMTGYCVGSTSRTCPSDIDPSVNHVPPTPGSERLTVNDPLSLRNDELAMQGVFAHEIPSVCPENEQSKDIDEVNPDDNHETTNAQDIDEVNPDNSHETTNPANEEDIFDGLDVIVNLENLDEKSEPDYMELVDLDSSADWMDVTGPSEGAPGCDDVGPLEPSFSFGLVALEEFPDSTQPDLGFGGGDVVRSWNEHPQHPDQMAGSWSEYLQLPNQMERLWNEHPQQLMETESFPMDDSFCDPNMLPSSDLAGSSNSGGYIPYVLQHPQFAAIGGQEVTSTGVNMNGQTTTHFAAVQTTPTFVLEDEQPFSWEGGNVHYPS